MQTSYLTRVLIVFTFKQVYGERHWGLRFGGFFVTSFLRFSSNCLLVLITNFCCLSVFVDFLLRFLRFSSNIFGGFSVSKGP